MSRIVLLRLFVIFARLRFGVVITYSENKDI